MADGLLGTLLGGAKNIGTGLMNIPTNIGQRYEAGELFGGGGVLGGLLGEEARKQAQDEAIMKMGLSLLGQGPSRTPISFGQSLAQGLLQGQQAYRQDLQGQLEDALKIKSLEDQSREREDALRKREFEILAEIRAQQKEAREQSEYEKKIKESEEQKSRKEAQARSGGIMAIDAIDKALNVINVSPLATGLPSQLLRGVEASSAGKLDSYYDTIRSKLGFTELQAMRENSPTGGALGQVSDRENQLLQSTIASLKTGLPKDTQIENLNKIKNHLAGIVYGAIDSDGNIVKLDTPEAVSKLYSGELTINYPSQIDSTSDVIKFIVDPSGNIVPQ